MSRADQWVLFGAGLIRGAITWAQALQMQGHNRRVMISTTLIVISTTLVLVGGLLPALLRLLGLVQNETQDAGEMEGVHEALSVRRQESLRSEGSTLGSLTGGAPSLCSPYNDIAEVGPAALSRQTSARREDEVANYEAAAAAAAIAAVAAAAEEEAMPLLPAEPPPAPEGLASAASAVSTASSDTTIPTRPPHLGMPRPGGGNGGGMPSWRGPVLDGRIHRWWVEVDERFLKPIFGGRGRMATPWTSYVGPRAGVSPHGSYVSRGGVYRHPPTYGAVGGGGGNGNGGELDPEALRRAFAQRGFHIQPASFAKAAAGLGKAGMGGGNGGGGGAGSNGNGGGV